MKTITLNINVDDYFEGSIMDRVAGMISDQVSTELRQRVQSCVSSSIKSVVEEKCAQIIEEELQKPCIKTNEWGEPTGNGVTLRQYVIDSFDKYMKQKVNYEGRLADHYDGKAKERWQYLIEAVGLKSLEHEVKSQIQKIREEALQQISGTIAALLAKNLSK